MSGKNGSAAAKEPDWGKFGLDNERKPLNPAASGAKSTGAVGTTPNPTSSGEKGPQLFGGQVQNDNELFADDQVRKNIDPVWNSFM